MLEVKNIQAWLESPQQKHCFDHYAPTCNGHRSVAAYKYRRRAEFDLHWRSTAGPMPFDASFEVFVIDQHGVKTSAATIWMQAGWEETQTRRDDLHQLFKNGGLKFPYVENHPKGRVVGALRLEIYRDQSMPCGPPNTAKRANRSNQLYAVFIFQFVDKLWECEDNEGDSDDTVDSAFHLPSSPDEGIPVASVLRPKLIRPTNRYSSESVSNKRKRKTSAATSRRMHMASSTNSSDEDESLSEDAFEGTTGKSYRRSHTFVYGPSTAIDTDRRANAGQASTSRHVEASQHERAALKKLRKVTQQLEEEEHARAQLLERLFKKQEQKLRKTQASNAELRKAFQTL